MLQQNDNYCPHCGACRHCGAKPYQTYPYYPNYPYIQYGTSTGTLGYQQFGLGGSTTSTTFKQSDLPQAGNLTNLSS